MPTELRPLSLLSRNKIGSHATRRGITRLTVDVPAPSRASEEPKPARWNTPEFFFYYLVFLLAVPWMVCVPILLSQPTHSNYGLYSHRLAPGWLFGRKFDNSDVQYRSFRSNIPALLAFLAIFFVLKAIYIRSAKLPSPTIPNRMHLLPFYTLFSLIMLAALHGSSAMKVLAILCGNSAITRIGKGAKWMVVATWIYNVAVLFANERYEGYRYGDISERFSFLDSFQGAYPRWHVTFNITMLRLVSFNMDYYWAHNRVGTPDVRSVLIYKQRTTTSHPLHAYSFRNYLAYVLYPPLYIGGPIMTFNDWMWQLERPAHVSMSSTLRYMIRFLGTLAAMEFIIHFMYVVAIKDAHAWIGDTPAELSMIGFWNLIVVWLKLLLPWRFFRMWALFDGMDPPENMVRCMANNYSVFGFWRSWHRSYNLWIVRYIHIPLGGSKRVVLSTLLVFTFVALWHDLSLRLLAWGWLVTLFILPELVARQTFTSAQFGDKWWYRHICALGAVANVLMMMTANLVGFAIGTDGMSYMASQIMGSWAGLRFFLCACAALFVGVQVMFEYREEELRNGISRRC
ncbi:MBOAT, membrane-bound O-acyltransferase family-domain-containing protein [Vararia minispora EC-137]|uniref:MBOAT, membrane-bound O-acyltransferase family-domain-containing protein n=1 Tax=Vararia minispora EC-137 TaxID=1314806 RepID=A0ACB8QUR5_9AGAM|nr:MBOAT, membrane-bound O-acyltransferase family-domain-containing protein [Vararia minispora EC-137]